MKKLIVIAIIASFLVSCSSSEIETFSTKKPYSIEITKERSYYQASKISERLKEMGIDAFIVNKVDSIEGEWYCIMYGAINNKDTASVFMQRIMTQYNLKNLSIIDYNSLDSFKVVQSRDSIILGEKKRIEAKQPVVPKDIFEVVKSFPHSNALYLQNVNVAFFSSDLEQSEKSLIILENNKNDLPRGITFKWISNDATCFSEAVFQDNLYGDKVTIQAIKLKSKTKLQNASLFNISIASTNAYSIAEIYANLILETGNYDREEKTKIEINAKTPLYGYKVLIKLSDEITRTYYVLVDETESYLYFSQSTEKTDQEMIKILSSIGKSNGLVEYDEFYNTFYILPSEPIADDFFLGFYINKLTPNYAAERAYAKWSVEMVGHWVAEAYFYNTQKGMWSFSIFDLISTAKQEYIYGTLYSKASHTNKSKVDVYGTSGHLVYHEDFDWNTYTTSKTLAELNFAKGRYACAIGNAFSDFDETDLVEKAQSLQFTIGGFNKN